MLVDLGLGTTALAREIVAIHDGKETRAVASVPFLAWAGSHEPRCWVLLRPGYLVPSYVTARLTRERWRDALIEVERLRTKREQAVKFGGDLDA